MSILYLVSTPIGNLKDITLRALEVLKEVDLIISEDTRRTGFLLKHYRIEKPLLSYQEHNELKRIPEVIQKLKSGLDIALVTDAGTPLISDPGFKLARECVKEKIAIVSIPGPSSVLTSLTSSGLPTDKFFFLGYLPRKESQLKKLIEKVIEINNILKTTFIAFESPYRVVKSLETFSEDLPGAEIVIARELTKLHEEIIRGEADEVLKILEPKGKVKGEIVVLISIIS